MIERRQRQLFIFFFYVSDFTFFLERWGRKRGKIPLSFSPAVAHFGVSFMGRQRRVHKYKSGPAHSCRNWMQMSIQKYDDALKCSPRRLAGIYFLYGIWGKGEISGKSEQGDVDVLSLMLPRWNYDILIWARGPFDVPQPAHSSDLCHKFGGKV